MDDIEVFRYEIGIIVNENRNTVCVTNDLETANYVYESTVTKYSKYDDSNHNIVFLYDYDKNTNINYYDNRIDIC